MRGELSCIRVTASTELGGGGGGGVAMAKTAKAKEDYDERPPARPEVGHALPDFERDTPVPEELLEKQQ